MSCRRFSLWSHLLAALRVPEISSTCCDLDVLHYCGPVIMLAKTTDLATPIALSGAHMPVHHHPAKCWGEASVLLDE
jgi:hypothetical protein